VFFIFTESLIGAGLVLFRLTAEDDSVARAVSMMTHLVNTFLLLAALTLTAWIITFGQMRKNVLGRANLALFSCGVIGMFILGASGAVAALGDTLFPVSSFAEGVRQEFTDGAHYLVRLRVFHPPIAILVCLYILWVGRKLLSQFPSVGLKRSVEILTLLVGVQLGLGLLNVWLAAPIWLQLVHLLMTTLIWIAYVLTGITGWVASNLSPGIGKEQIHQGIEPAPAQQTYQLEKQGGI
jgi:heme A synthase